MTDESLTALVIAQRRLNAATDHRVACQVKLENARGDEETARRKVGEELRKAAAAIPVNRGDVTLTDGSPVPADGSHQQDRGDGQLKGYVVLSDAERAKGFVRPVRNSYIHVGPPGPKYPLEDLTDEQKLHSPEYVKFERYPESMSPRMGRYWTAADIAAIGKGCGTKTIMGRELSETYARDPHFYGGTFCCGCGKHFPVGERGEFVWEGTDERVGT